MLLITNHSMEILFVSLVPGRTQVIALRRSYDDGCRRQLFRQSLAIHRTVYTNVHTHVKKKTKKSISYGD
jgi:hypothetical protein